MRRRRRASKSASTVLWLLAVVVSFAIGGFVGARLAGRPERAEIEPPAPPAAPESAVAEQRPAAPTPAPPAPEPPPGHGARVALVIDDFGRSVEDVDRFAGLPVPVTYSVLPFEHSTASVVQAIKRRGGQLLCHLPMEPASGANPGPGALNAAMSENELSRATAVALDAVDGAIGANHHMGSRLSTDERSMKVVLGVLGRRGLIYLDSRTSADSVAYRIGRDLGVPSLERQVFLDPDRDPEAIRTQFRRLLAIAAERGAAVAIGHPYRETEEVLRQELPRALAAGFEFVEISALIER